MISLVKKNRKLIKVWDFMKYILYLIVLLFCQKDLLPKESKNIIFYKKNSLIQNNLNINKLNEFLSFQSNYEPEVNMPYSNCGREFPELPGNFPCSFLMDEYTDALPTELEARGNLVSIRKAIKNWSGGGVYEVSSGEADEYKMSLFYDKNKYIISYTYRDFLVLFHWKGKQEKSLMKVEILSIRENEISGIKRIYFYEK